MSDNKTPMDIFLEFSSQSVEGEFSIPVTFKVKQGTLILPAISGWQYLFEADGIKCIKATEMSDINKYIPYSEEWEKEMMKWSKADLIDFLRQQLLKIKELENQKAQ